MFSGLQGERIERAKLDYADFRRHQIFADLVLQVLRGLCAIYADLITAAAPGRFLQI